MKKVEKKNCVSMSRVLMIFDLDNELPQLSVH